MSNQPTWEIEYGNFTLEGYAEDEEVVVSKDPNEGQDVYRELIGEEPKETQKEVLEVTQEEVLMTAEYLSNEADWEDPMPERNNGRNYSISVNTESEAHKIEGRAHRSPLGREFWDEAAREVKSFYIEESGI